MNNLPKVAIQGDRASFHEIAAHKYYTYPVELIYCQSFEEAFQMLTNRLVDKAFIAISNTAYGEIKEVALLIANEELNTEGEYLLPIDQHIIGLTNTDLRSITKIISHPVALSQCDLYLAEHHKYVAMHEYHDTSAAVELVQRLSDPTVVAIGSEAAAKLHGLKILRRNIQNDPNNATLFRSLILK